MHVCIHEAIPDKPGTYKYEDSKLAMEASHVSDPNFITHATKTNNIGLGGRVWAEREIFWRLDSDSPDIEGRKQEIELIKLAFLETSLKTNLVIRGRRKQSQDAHIVINWTSEDRLFKERPSVLAYAYGPGSGIGGDITMNDNYIWSVDGKYILGKAAVEAGLVENAAPNAKLRTYDALHTMKHEGGHATAMPHLDKVVFKDDVMFPYYNGQRHFGTGDIDLLYQLYDPASFSDRMMFFLERYLTNKIGRFGHV